MPQRNAKPKVASLDDRLLEHLQSLTHDDLCSLVIVPFYQQLGYERVEVHGGPNEGGKDVIAWRADALGEPELLVAQVKRYEFSSSASAPRGLPGVLTQLHQAIAQRVADSNLNVSWPTHVHLITPYPVSQRVQDACRQELGELKRDHVRLIDGPKLVALLTSRTPELARALVRPELIIADSMRAMLTNAVLTRALGLQKHKRVDEIFTELDLVVGRSGASTFLYSPFTPELVTARMSPRACFDLVDRLEATARKLDLGGPGIPAVELKAESSRLGDLLETLERDAAELEREHNDIRTRNQGVMKMLRDRALSTGDPDDLNTADYLQDVFYRALSGLRGELSSDLQLATAFLGEPTFDDNVRGELLRSVSRAEEIRRKLQRMRDRITRCALEVELSLGDISAALERRRDRARAKLESWQRSRGGGLREILLELRDCLEIAEGLSVHRDARTAVGLPRRDRFPAQRHHQLPFSLPDVVGVGFNTLLYGEAGAGKTTSLQRLALSRLSAAEHDVTIFAPLATLVRAWQEQTHADDWLTMQPFESGLLAFLRQLDARVSKAAILRALGEPGCVLLLDGIDEAIGRAPWLGDSIWDLRKRYANVRVVMTSRIAAERLRVGDYFPVRLLPFSPEQARTFFRSWFVDSPERLTRVEAHLAANPEVAGVVANPLLATILCALVERDVPLPQTEVRLYEERFRLLLGYYDAAKGIRRTTSDERHRERFCRRLAFNFHKTKIRYDRKESIVSFAIECFEGELNHHGARTLVDDLLEPSSILEEMTSEGEVGFGHLRHQEYLAALELTRDRSIAVWPFLGDEWWTDCLLLFGRMADNLEWLAIDAPQGLLEGRGSETLRRILESRTTTELRRIRANDQVAWRLSVWIDELLERRPEGRGSR